MHEEQINTCIGKLMRSVIRPQSGETALILGDISSRRIHELLGIHLADYGIQAFISSVREGFSHEWLAHMPEHALQDTPRNIHQLFLTSNIIIITGSMLPEKPAYTGVPETKYKTHFAAFMRSIQSGAAASNRWFLIPLPSVRHANAFQCNYEDLLDSFWQMTDIDYEAYTLKTGDCCTRLFNGSELRITHNDSPVCQARIFPQTSVFLDGCHYNPAQPSVPEMHILPKGELTLKNILPVHISDDLQFYYPSGSPAPVTGKQFCAPDQAVNEKATELSPFSMKYEVSLTLGLNGTLTSPSRFPFLDAKLIGYGMFTVSKTQNSARHYAMHQNIESFAPFKYNNLYINNIPLLYNGKINF